MSKATNTVTFGKTNTGREMRKIGGRNSWTPILLNGVRVGTIFKDGTGGYANFYEVQDHEGRVLAKFYCDWADGHGNSYDSKWDWATGRSNAKAFAKEHFAAIEMPEVIVADDEIFIRGELVGSIARKDQCRSTGWNDKLAVVTINGEAFETHPVHARELAIEKATEAAQAETVEVEEAAQADDTEIVYSVDFLGFDLDGREFRVSEYGTAQAAHAAAKEFARSRADYGDQVRFEAFHGNGNSKIQTIYFNGFASGYIEKTVELTEEAGTARLLALIFDEEEQAQAETAEAEEPAQAFAPGDAVIATYKGAQSRGVVVREYVCPDHRKGYPDERFYSSPEDPVYVVKVRGKDREIAYRASHLKRCLEAHA